MRRGQKLSAMRAGTVLSLLTMGACASTSNPTDTPPTAQTCVEAAPAAGDGEGSAVAAEAPAVTYAEGERLDLDRLFADPPLTGSSMRSGKFSPDGARYAFLDASTEDSEVLDLWAVDLSGGAPLAKPLVKTTDLIEGNIVLSEEERMQNERKRIRHRGITAFKWCGKKGDALLFPLSQDLYLVTLGEGEPVSQRLTSDAKAKLNPKCSPDGKTVAYVQDGNVVVKRVGAGKPVKLTKGAKPGRTFGLAEFVAQEEMGRYEGLWFSPDGKKLAVLEVDESKVAVKVRPRIYADRTEMFEQRYPAAGETNATVTVHVFDIKKKKGTKVTVPAQKKSEDPGYIGRVDFAPDGSLLVQWQNRAQTDVIVYRGAGPRYKLKPVLTEHDDAWVELHDDLLFLPDGTMVWPSERDGVRQLYGVAADGKQTALTAGGDPVLDAHVVTKAGALYYTKAVANSTQRHLFVRSADGKERQLTTTAGTHRVTVAKSGAFVDNFSTVLEPTVSTLHDASGKQLAVLRAEKDTPWAKVKKPDVRFVQLPAADGKTMLNGVIYPALGASESHRAPVMVYVYGGPHAQLVTDSFARRTPFFVHMAQRGYTVFIVDNRGSGNRNRAFTRAIKNRFADIEVEDQLAAVAWLKNNEPTIDPERIGVFGWSYGGTMSALLISAPDTPFAAAVSVAPVTDWTLYDTHYTERYIGTPQGNAAVYKKAQVVDRLASLDRPFLLMHGMADDNVLFENSLQLVSRLQDEGRVFDLMVYPGRAHGLSGRKTQRHVYRSLAAFLDSHLMEPRQQQ